MLMDAKELAFIHDLYIAPDWGERFAELFDEHIELPEQGEIAYLGAGTGSHVLALAERVGEKTRIVCVEESSEQLDLARAKANAVKADPRVEFHTAALDSTGLQGARFQLVIVEASLLAPSRLPRLFAEAVRLAAPRSRVALSTVTAASFGEFFSIYWEALGRSDMEGSATEIVGRLINELPTVDATEEMARRAGLRELSSWTRIEEFRFDSGNDFLASPLIKYLWLRRWLAQVTNEEARERVRQEIKRLIDKERHSSYFPLTFKATLVSGTTEE